MASGKWIADLTGTTPLAEAARRVLTVRLEAVRDYLPPALQESERDPEHVHQLRVATRRAGAALETFALCLPSKIYRDTRKKLRRLRRVAGAARDWDVFLIGLNEWRPWQGARHGPGVDFLFGYGVAQRDLAQLVLHESTQDYPFDFDRMVSETVAAVQRPVTSQTLTEWAGPRLTGLARDLSEAAGQPLEDYGYLHQVRILGKRLRYAMEIFADCFGPAFREELYPAVEQMQEILGRANDSHVAVGRLMGLRDRLQLSFPAQWKQCRPGIESLLRFHQQRLPRERQLFLEWWSRWELTGGEAALAALWKAPVSAAS